VIICDLIIDKLSIDCMVLAPRTSRRVALKINLINGKKSKTYMESCQKSMIRGGRGASRRLPLWAAFTLIELLVVIAIIAKIFFWSHVLPGLSAQKTSGKGSCA